MTHKFTHVEDSLNPQPLEKDAVESTLSYEYVNHRYNTKFISLDEFSVPTELFRYISAEECHKQKIIPYSLRDNVLIIVTADATDVNLAQHYEAKYGFPVRLRLSTAEEIEAALLRSESGSARLRGITEGFRQNQDADREESETGGSAHDSIDDDKHSSPIIRFINTLLQSAITKRASDIHIEAHQNSVSVKYRIDGVLYQATDVIDKKHHNAFVSRLKVMSELDIAEKRIPQDGRFSLRIDGRLVDFRLSVLPASHGEDVVIRILDKSSISDNFNQLNLDQLGLSDDVLKKLRKSIREPYGMILITGPTGSGKTTTLYAALSELNSGEEKVITIEDPVEYQLNGIIQIPVNEKKGLTFARGLRSILRHDPDQIMVGEIRDPETATIAVQSALTGHLVFTTVHANNTFDVVSRFIHMGIDPYSFISSLNCVMAQRLIRLICPSCKSLMEIDDDLLEISGLSENTYKKHQWFHGTGCQKCNGTGYSGRAAITELLSITPTIRQMLIDQKPVAEIREAAISNGFKTLRQSALNKALDGMTTLREINRVTFVD